MKSIFNITNSESTESTFKVAVKLLGKGDDTEIIKYDIPHNSMFVINPAEHPKAYELYYVLQGELKRNNEIVQANGYIETLNLNKSISFIANGDTTILLFVSRTGEYNISSDFHKNLTEQLQAIENKDHYTFHHCKRVKRLVHKMGIKLQLKDADLRDLVLAANFHDIGKVNIPDEILNNPGQLNDEEFRSMKEHVDHSYEILNAKMSSEVIDILIQHHERLDGTGYPKGLTGANITFFARILAIADTYDAMTTDRVYKKGKSSTEAIEELFSLKNQYDESIVKILEEIISDDMESSESSGN